LEFVMGSFSLVHWVIVLIVVLLLFGRGRVSEIMGDFGKGIKSFKQGLNEDAPPLQPGAQPGTPTAQIPPQIPPTPPASQATLNGETVIDSSQSTPR
jgi:sec-independent protein translocase protein TatA